MTRPPNASQAADPWRYQVVVAQIPDTGLHRDIEADPVACEAMAELAEVREIRSAHASFDVTLRRDGRVHVAGWVRALVGQTCVVTLDPRPWNHSAHCADVSGLRWWSSGTR